MPERWKDVVDFEGSYEVSDLGRVRSVNRTVVRSNGAPHPWAGRILATSVRKKGGHVCVRLHLNGRGRTIDVHRLVGEAFLGPLPAGMETLHRDGDPTHNAASNLTYGTKSENNADRVRHGTHHNAAKTHCIRDHELTEPNLVPSLLRRGKRACLSCARARGHARKTNSEFNPELADQNYAAIVCGPDQEVSAA